MYLMHKNAANGTVLGGTILQQDAEPGEPYIQSSSSNNEFSKSTFTGQYQKYKLTTDAENIPYEDDIPRYTED